MYVSTRPIMKIEQSILFILTIKSVLSYHYGDFYAHLRDFDNEGLILTPLIEEGLFETAQNASAVKLSGFEDVESYAGYFTVDKDYNSNTFFWYFPAEDRSEFAPVLLWLQGGPGMSSLYGLFQENGPFSYKGHRINRREDSFNKKYHTLYLDNPVGTGFSFTEEGYAKNITIIGEHLYVALVQFFTVFPSLKDRDFYIAGESYAGKYILAAASEIHSKNNENDFKINLKGFAIGNGVISPLNQYDYGNFFYEIGMLDHNQLKSVDNLYKKWKEQFYDINESRFGNFATYFASSDDSSIIKSTGYETLYDFREYNNRGNIITNNILESPLIREAVHAGYKHRSWSSTVYSELLDDLFNPMSDELVMLLGYYKTVIYHGQFDLLIPYRIMDDFLLGLQFPECDKYREARQKAWLVNGKLTGYKKKAGNLTMVLVLGAGHSVGEKMEQMMIPIVDLLFEDK